MPIESKIPTEEINIKELSINQGETEKVGTFDAEKEITKSDWEKMQKEFNDYRSENIWSLVPSMAVDMKILNPKSAPQLSEQEWHVLKSRFMEAHEHVRDEGGSSPSVKWHNLVDDAADLKILDQSWDPEFTAEDWRDIKSQYISNRQASGRRPYWDLFSLIAQIKIVNPDFDLDLIEEDWSGIKRELKSGQKEEEWRGSVANIAYSMKIINPDIDLDLKPEDWANMKAQLTILRKGSHAREFAELAKKMKVLASPKVSIPRAGILELAPLHTDLSKPQKILPEIKKF